MSFADEHISSAYASRGVAGHMMLGEVPVQRRCLTYDGDEYYERC